MRPHLLLAIFSFGSASPFAYAQVDESEFFVPFWYAGASVAHNDSRQIKDESSQCDGLNGIIDGLHLGYQFNPYFMAEVEYQYLGCMTTAEQLNDDMRQGVVGAKFGYPITDNITPYLKAGAAGWLGARSNGISGVVGVGLSYHVFDDVALNVEYQYTDPLGNDAIGEFAHQRFSLGIQYRFGHATPRVITIEKPVVREVIVEKIVEVEKIIEVESVPKIETVVISSTNAQAAMFENNSSILINTKALLSIVALLKKHPDTTVRIIGYTDSAGAESYNQWLSARRAGNVGDYLLHQGISADRVVTEGKGELEPIASNSTPAGRAMNRRVAIEFN